MTRAAPGKVPYEIAPDVLCLGPHGRSQTNVFLIRDGASWALVDAGWEQDAPRIIAAVRRLLGAGVAPSVILLTHVHPDHAGSARALATAWGCRVLVHPAERPIATGDVAAMAAYAGPLDRWLILPAMRALGRRRREEILARGSLAGIIDTLGPRGQVPGLEDWRWIATPGHTPGHVSYLRGDDRVVITGDALLTLRVNAWDGLLLGRPGLSGPPWYTTWDGAAAKEAIEDIAASDPSVIAPGHGWSLAGSGVADAVKRFAISIGGAAD